METPRVTKAVFPVGGLGTRFLPATKAIPKEMMTVVDKPLIQYAVEEAVAAGVDTLIFVTGRNKTAITNHFDKAYELEHQLEIKGKAKDLEVVRNIIPPHVDCIFIRQNEALGLGHAVLCAKKAIGRDPFAVVLADDMINGGDDPCLAQMVREYERSLRSIIAVEQVAHGKTDQYGIVQVDQADAVSTPIQKIVEKPKPEEAPSDLGVVGRYILDSRIFHHLEHTGRGAGNEIQLTDAIASLMTEQQVFAYRFNGIRYDCGSRGGFLEANLEYAWEDPRLRERMLTCIQRCQANESGKG